MPSKSIVNLDRISFIRNNTIILHDISLKIDRGQHWAIIGPNGSGKTSLVSIINGYHWPSEGTAEVLGKRFGSTDLRELRRHIGECSSEIMNMIHNQDSVMDIVLSGRFASIGLYETPAAGDHARAQELLEFFGLAEVSGRLFGVLSDGEKKKTIIARALMPEPELLVLDEPCAGLDLKAREGLLDAVENMCNAAGGPTLIYISHHIEEIIPAITHALVLRKGRMVARGAKKDALTGEVLSSAFDIPIELVERNGRFWPVLSFQ
ncbi:putative branched-chain amino acid transport ATP-binding protein LivG [uncultured archaeon]|nr:putative branched-chain amino acid transport ATP-binding protein LivG [uncultured archaeon]